MSVFGFLDTLSQSVIKPGLERMHEAVKRLGNIHERLPIVHVAGTNGKGSTCAMVSSILVAHGLKVGLHTSPHLVDVRERFQVDGAWVNDEELERSHRRIQAAVSDLGCTYFEYTVLLALEVFCRTNVDVVVLEVGLGGRLDATNVVRSSVSVVTPIGLDHQAWLGSTVGQIATEKAGIFRRSTPAIIAAQVDEALRSIEVQAKSTGTPLEVEGQDFRWKSGVDKTFEYEDQWIQFTANLALAGSYQYQNAAVATRAACAMLRLLGREPNPALLAQGLGSARWPGRFEPLQTKWGPLIVDGAHNPHGLAACLSALKDAQRRPYRLCFGAFADKDLAEMGRLICAAGDLFAGIHVAPLEHPRSATAADLASHFGGRAVLHTSVQEMLHAASELASVRAETVVVAGSLYLVGQVRGAVSNREKTSARAG